MNIPPHTALYFSLFVILVYWAYQILTADTIPTLPAGFAEFAGVIAFRKLIHFSAIFLLLRIEGAGWQEMGVSANEWKKRLLAGLFFGLILFVLFNVGMSSALESIFPKPEASGNSIMMYFQNSQNLIVWIIIGIFGGGVVEELLRIFVLTRFEKAFHKPGLYVALICSSVVFGIGHLYQGTGAAVSSGLYGFVIGTIFIRRRSALEVITAHAFSDVLAILAASLLAARG